MSSITDPGIERLLGSSPSTGAPPTFEPIATASATGDAAEQPSAKVGGPPSDPVFAAIEAHRAAYDAWTADAADGRDLESDGPLSQAQETALHAVEEATPETVAGLKAWVDYVALLTELGDWSISERVLPRINDALQDLVHAAPLSVIGTGYDAELVALGAELDRILALIPAAYAERFRLEAERDNSLPPVPDGLIVDPDHRLGEDIEFFTASVPGDETGRRYYTGKAIARIRTVPRTKYVFERWVEEGKTDDQVVKRVPDDELQTRADAVVAAFEPWDKACRLHSAAIGYDDAAARHDDLERQARATFDRIEMLTPLTLAGLAVQARTMVTYSRGNFIRHSVVERLEEFARASAPPDVGRDDPFVALFRQANAARDRVNDTSLSAETSEAELDDLQRVCDAVVGGTVPASATGVVAALEWALAEFEEFHTDEEDARDKGGQLMVALLRGALGVMRRHVISAAAPAGTVDLTPALLAEKRQSIAIIDEQRYATEAEADALMDRWGACDAAVIARPATTPAGASASIEWARDELLRFGFDPTNPAGGGRLVLSLLDGALAVLRGERGVSDESVPSREAA